MSRHVIHGQQNEGSNRQHKQNNTQKNKMMQHQTMRTAIALLQRPPFLFLLLLPPPPSPAGEGLPVSNLKFKRKQCCISEPLFQKMEPKAVVTPERLSQEMHTSCGIEKLFLVVLRYCRSTGPLLMQIAVTTFFNELPTHPSSGAA
jgi:hypothetical protein